MDKNQAIKILIQAVEIAQLKGAYALKDAQAISIAVDILSQKEEVKPEENTDEKK